MKCAVELSKYDISYLPRRTVKAQALADYVSKMASPSQEESLSKEVWLLHVDGSATLQGSGASIIIKSLQGEAMEFVVKFDFKRFKLSSLENAYSSMVERRTSLGESMGDCHIERLSIRLLDARGHPVQEVLHILYSDVCPEKKVYMVKRDS
ncbi:UNVERIFIED_CONTAM: hypothetical protein Sangu_2779900 [Sesamum angustifolium]|uniref:Uncharacterized protein n=1 Tax=Sesamum angustifolium TaxID=2727405 RepID=A0AAW2IVH0_9LAMI